MCQGGVPPSPQAYSVNTRKQSIRVCDVIVRLPPRGVSDRTSDQGIWVIQMYGSPTTEAMGLALESGEYSHTSS